MDIESTDVDQSADDLRGDVMAAMEEVDTPEETEELVTAETDEEAGVEDTTEEEPEEDAEEEAAEEAPAGIEAPAHWSPEHRAMFEALGRGELEPKDAQDFLLARHKDMEGDYTRKMQGRAEFDRAYQPIEDMLAPHMDNLRAAGVNQTQYLSNLMNADKMLNDNPMQGIQQIAQMYGIDLGNMSQTEQAQVDPQVSQLQQELAQLRGSIEQDRTAAANTKRQTFEQKITEFSQQTDESGAAAHPHFDAVLDDMITLAHAERQAGREPELSALYDKATWANPEVRQAILSEQKKADKAKALSEAKAKAKKAEKASASIKGGSGTAPSAELSLREELAAQLNG